MNKMHFSIIIPVYNQDEFIKSLIMDYNTELQKLKKKFEVLIISNGKNTLAKSQFKNLLEKYPSFSIYFLKKSGWGQSVKFGLSKARGDYICYTNSANTKPEDLVLMLKYAFINKSVVIKATRIHRESFFRKVGSILYNFEYRIFFKIPLWDVNATPKVFHRNLLKKIYLLQNGDLLDAELLAKCYKNNFHVIEIPIITIRRYSKKSTTNFISAIKMYMGLIKLKINLKP